GTAARLVVGQVRAGAGIIGLLGFPGYQAVFDVDLPAARTGTVDAVSRADNLVVLPPLAIAALPLAIFISGHTVTFGKGFPLRLKVPQLIEKVTHSLTPEQVRAMPQKRRHCPEKADREIVRELVPFSHGSKNHRHA